MPRMTPLSWVTLFMYFIILYILINPMNYFLHNKKSPDLKSIKIQKSWINWKW